MDRVLTFLHYFGMDSLIDRKGRFSFYARCPLFMFEVSDWAMQFDLGARAQGWRFSYIPTSWAFDLRDGVIPFKYAITRMNYYTRREMLQGRRRPF